MLHVTRYWPYGSEGCQTHGFHGFLTALASIHFIAAIAWDRYHQYCTSKYTQCCYAQPESQMHPPATHDLKGAAGQSLHWSQIVYIRVTK